MPRWVKSLAIIVALLGSIAGSIYAIDDRYVTDKEAATSLESFNSKMDQEVIKIRMQILELSKNGIITEYYKHKELIRAYPNDKELKQELIEIRQRRDIVDQKIEAILESGS